MYLKDFDIHLEGLKYKTDSFYCYKVLEQDDKVICLIHSNYTNYNSGYVVQKKTAKTIESYLPYEEDFTCETYFYFHENKKMFLRKYRFYYQIWAYLMEKMCTLFFHLIGSIQKNIIAIVLMCLQLSKS